jgi:hypothetical protein
MRLDLQTYPVPAPLFTLNNLARRSAKAGMDVVAITEFTTDSNHPDKRFDRFFKDTYDLGLRVDVLDSPFEPAGFSVYHKKGQVTFVQAQCGWVTYEDTKFQLLRVGQCTPATPEEGVYSALHTSRDHEAVILIGRIDYGNPEAILRALKDDIDGVVWDAQARFRQFKEGNEDLRWAAHNLKIPIVPVSNAHMAYWPIGEGVRIFTRPDIGVAHLSTQEIKDHPTSTIDLTQKVKQALEDNKYKPEEGRSHWLHTLAWQATQVLRGKAGFTGRDYPWHGHQ